jgi:hypothetical protein
MVVVVTFGTGVDVRGVSPNDMSGDSSRFTPVSSSSSVSLNESSKSLLNDLARGVDGVDGVLSAGSPVLGS